MSKSKEERDKEFEQELQALAKEIADAAPPLSEEGKRQLAELLGGFTPQTVIERSERRSKPF